MGNDLNMKFIFLFLLFLTACSSHKTSQKLDESINLEVKKIELKNGLKVLVVPNTRLPIFSLYMFYKVGGKNETPGITGASHFLEHMMFKGARKFGKNTIDFIIEGSGGSTNAYTTNDHTVYYENLPSSQLETILDIEADRLENLLLDPQDFEKERAVVLEERKMRYENSPRGQLYLALMENLYQGTPYGRSVIGDIKDLKSVTRAQIHDYFKKFYAPNNLTMVVVGDVDVKKIESIVSEKFSKIRSSEKVSKLHQELKDEFFTPKISSSKTVNIKGESPNPIFMLAYPTVKVGDPEGYALDILSSILGSGKSSALMNDFVYVKKPMATKLYASHQSLEKSGFFYFGGDLLQGISVKEFENYLKNKLKNYCETEITSKNIAKVKNNYLLSLYSSLESNAGLAQFLGDRELLFGDWAFYKDELKAYEAVSVDQVRKSCLDLFNKPGIFVSVWEKHK